MRHFLLPPGQVQGDEGNSLLAVMMALGISGAILASLTTLVSNAIHAEKRISLRSERQEIKNFVMQGIDCGATFPKDKYSWPATCTKPETLRTSTGRVLVDAAGSKLGSWYVKPECAPNGGLFVKVARPKPGKSPLSNNADDFATDPLNGQPLDFRNQQAMLFSADMPLCAHGSDYKDSSSDDQYANVAKGTWLGLCTFTAHPQSPTCNKGIVSPARRDKSCPRGFAVIEVTGRVMGNSNTISTSCIKI